MARTRKKAEPGEDSAANASTTELPRRKRASRKRVEAPVAAVQAADPVAAPKERTWKDDLADVQKAAFWLWLGVIWLPSLTLPALSGKEVPGVIWRAIQSGSISSGEAVSVWNVFVLTAPLTTAVAIVGVALCRGWFDNSSFMEGLFFACMVLMGTTLLAKGLSLGAKVELIEVCTWNAPPINWVINLTASYAKVYTLGMFASSLSIGSFGAWVWSSKIMPRLCRG